MTKLQSKSERDESPPAYIESQHPTNAVVSHGSSVRGHNDTLPVPTVPQIHVCTKHDDINGTFYIDPSASRLYEPPSKAERKLLDGAHASFRSRHGNITLDLGTTGYGARASAVIANRKGDVNVNILPLSPGRPHISLDVSSRKGKVVLFIPDTYHGVLRLNTKKGDLHILPGLSQVMQTFKMTSKEALVYVGTKREEHVGDYCQITTKHGAIVVGIAGRDRYEGETGLLKVLGKAISQLIR